MRTADWTDAVSVLDRVTAVFDAFGDDEALGVSELARRANLPKSTVSRIAADLVEQRLLDRDGDKLSLGIRLFEFGQTVQQPRLLRTHALPVMAQLRNLTGYAVHLAVRDGADVVVIAALRGSGPAAPAQRVGARHPAHATAAGRAMLAFSPAGPLDQPALQRDLAEVRRGGVAVESGDGEVGRPGLAAPVLGHGNIVVAAVGVTASVDDIGSVDALVQRSAPAVRASAQTLARRLVAPRSS
ncbi:IclR family transcriptional regulator [Microbacterium sp. HD4P20]|uniref:IclR family transcriptional regulator n=1 Tax=Microbacterium sp. HD4P20 TaxID=2864874 RepID=UPI001C641473|nr:IclR family transcriptional regulator [Microbacterium sp. HD4P20]MCP2635507.1 IclR family transcriptional regulator [Microbacterium sp. HD4P20]